ncbi:MAG: endo alpha-1,4 polygalactosaminidase [bacterium]
MTNKHPAFSLRLLQILLLCALVALGTGNAFAADSDADGVDDLVDNCQSAPNPDRADIDLDGFGNTCDPDFDNNLMINLADGQYLKNRFFGNDPLSDTNGDARTNFAELSLLKDLFGQSPGPSCCGGGITSAIPAGTSWYWQLTGTLETTHNAQVYDVDLFDTSTAQLAALKAAGHTVICYFSGGSYEEWRPDVGGLPAAAIGNPLDGWPGEAWFDIRHSAVRQLAQDRLDLAKTKGCDGVEPDNVDGYTNNPGFPLTAADQVDFNTFLAIEAHKRYLLVGLKNAADLVPQLVNLFDFSVVEQCYQYNECEAYSPFIARNKAVLEAEYPEPLAVDQANCDASAGLGFSLGFYPMDLDGGVLNCP